MRRLASVSLLTLVVAASALAQASSKGVVAVDPIPQPNPAPAGAEFEVGVSMRIRSGYHTNANKPSEDYLIGTSLKLTPPAGVTISRIAYPAAKYHKFSFSEQPLAVYDGTVKITVVGYADRGAAPGPITLPGKLTFQACNDEQCLPPSTVDVSIPVEIGPARSAPIPNEGEDASEGEASQTLTLTGAPPEALIFIDGKQVGRANASGRFVAKDLKTGRRRVRVEQEGFQAWEQAVEVSPERPQTLAVALVVDPAAAPVAAPAPPAPETAATPAPVAPAPAPAAAEPSTGSNFPLWIAIVVAVLALGGITYFATKTKRSHG